MIKRLLYLSFLLVSSVSHKVRGRFTKAGILVLSALGASAVVGLDTNQTVAYQAFAFLLFVLLVAMAWCAVFRVRLTVHRMLPKFATTGERLEYRLSVHNESGKGQTGLYLSEDLEDPRPSLEEFRHTTEPGEEERNWFDRTIGYHRWLWLISKKRGAIVKEHAVPSLPPNGEREILVEVMPLRRGRLNLPGPTVACPDPFGLFKSFANIPVPQSVLVLPKRYDLPPIELPGTRRYQPGGVSLAMSVGDSQEFVSMRDYRPGDPLRRIHWKSWAKTGKPIVKEYQDEFFVRHALILDTFQETEHTQVFEEAVSIAASFACTVQTQESLLDLMFVGAEAYCFTVGRGVAHTDKMLEILASVKPCTDKPFSALPPLILKRSSLLSGCICILVSWDEERRGLVHLLKTLGVPTLVLMVTGDKDSDILEAETTKEGLENFRTLELGKIQEGLANL